jgi:tRNA (mo5U34)-methyltransferase
MSTTAEGHGFSFEKAQELVRSVPHWHHRFEIYSGLVTPGTYDPEPLWSKLALEGRVQGKRVLDVGASDGFFTQRITQLGGDVTAVDFRPKHKHGFHVTETLSGREFAYEHANIYDLDADLLGRFDIVLFLGVLYHLPDMMRAFHKLRSLCGSTLLLETHYAGAFSPEISAARYYRGDSLAGDITNFWSPNRLCVLDMLHDAGFDPVRDEGWTDRLFVEATVSNDPGRSYKMDVAYGRL